MQERTTDKIAAAATAPFFILAVVLNSIWIDIRKPTLEVLKASAVGVTMALPIAGVYYWLNGALPY